MTGNGHRFTGVGAAFVGAAVAHLSGLGHVEEVVAAITAAASTTLPDWLEIPKYRKGRRVGTVIKHRTITHWALPWIALVAWGVLLTGVVGALMIGAGIGALYHLLGDAPNPMGVPWLWPTKRLRIGKKGLWRSGQNELLFGLFLNALGFAVWKAASLTEPGSVLTKLMDVVI